MVRTVLLVDDAAFLRAMLRAILESTGRYRIAAEAADGVDALTLAPEHLPDLVISDLIMPRLDGIELTRSLRGAEPPFRVVVAAAADQEGALLNALAAGAGDFIPKPFSPDEVLGILEEPRPAPAGSNGPARSFALSIRLAEATPLPRARWEVIRSHCRELGELEREPEEGAEASSRSARRRSWRLRSAVPSDIARGWIATLPGVADVEIREIEEEVPEGLPHPLAARELPGTVRLRVSLLDRLLDSIDDLRADREEIARRLASPGPRRADADSAELMARWQRSLARMRAEILTARLVPFHRVAARLDRCVEEAARRSGRPATLRLEGSATRLDLAVLDEIASLLIEILPRAVESERAAPESGNGPIPDPDHLRLEVRRNGTKVGLTLDLPADFAGSTRAILGPALGDRVRGLGGTAGMVRNEGRWRVEMAIPAGVTVVRSYLCRTGDRLLAIPVGSVERAVEVATSRIRFSEGRSFWRDDSGEPVPLVRLSRVPWVEADSDSRNGFPGLVYRVGPQRYALAVDALLGETDVVVRPLSEAERRGSAAGIALMPDGVAAMIPDLPRLARMR